MSTVGLARDDYGQPAPMMALSGPQTITLTSTSANVQLVAGDRVGAFVTLIADVACFVALGADNTVAATSSDHYVAAGERREFAVPADTLYLAAIRSTADGTLWLSQYVEP